MQQFSLVIYSALIMISAVKSSNSSLKTPINRIEKEFQSLFNANFTGKEILESFDFYDTILIGLDVMPPSNTTLIHYFEKTKSRTMVRGHCNYQNEILPYLAFKMRDISDVCVKFEYLVYIFNDGKLFDCCMLSHALQNIQKLQCQKLRTIKKVRNIFNGKIIGFKYCPFDNVGHEQDLVMKRADKPWTKDYAERHMRKSVILHSFAWGYCMVNSGGIIMYVSELIFLIVMMLIMNNMA